MVQGVTCGGMAEWSKAAVLKTVVRKHRGFESYFLRHTYWRGDREADGARLLSECGGQTPPRVRIPPPPPGIIKGHLIYYQMSLFLCPQYSCFDTVFLESPEQRAIDPALYASLAVPYVCPAILL